MTVRVVCISDTHNQQRRLPKLPDGDVLVHAGDFTLKGTQKEILDFNDWLGEQDHPYKIVVPGNHEFAFQESWWTARAWLSNADYVLKDQGCEVMGKKLWGSPYTPEFRGWAFGYGAREGEVRWSQIPEGLDLLITHGPPHTIFDAVLNKQTKALEHYGCPGLLREVVRAKPKFHVFGHVHEGYGRGRFHGVEAANVSQLDGQNQIDVCRAPVVVDL